MPPFGVLIVMMINTNKIEFEKLHGRQISVPAAALKEYPARYERVPAIRQVDTSYYCSRCNSICNAFLPGQIAYCRECIGLGRVTANDYLVRIPDAPRQLPQDSVLTWTGKLTPAQERVSRDLMASFTTKSNHLVHAVTGAGKTEMLFKVVATALSAGNRVCLATPRIDVVNELFPRFSQAFSNTKIGKYHGQEYSEPENNQLVICTTHQLLKFYHAFELVIIDEVDAFPYRDSRLLAFGAATAQKLSGCTFFLTATPAKEQLALVKKNQLHYSLLCRRFHGFDLPVPQAKLVVGATISQKGRINWLIIKAISKLIALQKPLMIFVPKIAQLDSYYRTLSKLFPTVAMASVHAGDAERLEKIMQFRAGELDLLLTTTILERGVTIREAQVIVLDADDRIYNTASLVQIAGRVGRAANAPSGQVYFFYHEYRESIQKAIKQIKRMNKHGK